jgi:23S rRNA (uracil1939-C5)-methyltransferase
VQGDRREICEIRLESLAFGGDAVGRLDGQVVFVPLGVAGDRARVRIVERRRSFSRAELLEVLEPGPGRREPPCPHAGACGGCQWQQVIYGEQIAAKQAVVARALGGVEELLPLRPAEDGEWGYRRRVRMAWQTTGTGEARIGFFQRRSRQLVDVDECPLLSAPLAEAVNVCRQHLASAVRGDAGGTLSLLAGAGGDVHLSLRVERGRTNEPPALLAAPVVGLVVTSRRGRRRQEARFGRDAVEIGSKLLGAADAFAQINPSQEARLREELVSWARPEGQRVLELHAGVGSLTRELTARASQVVAVERDRVACGLLKRNAPSVRLLRTSAEEAVQELAAAGERFDVVVLDPPRQGCARLSKDPALRALAPRRLIYLSCDPMTLARDLAALSDAFAPVRARACDMMPQTFHVEVLSLLQAQGE